MHTHGSQQNEFAGWPNKTKKYNWPAWSSFLRIYEDMLQSSGAGGLGTEKMFKACVLMSQQCPVETVEPVKSSFNEEG